MKSSNLLVFRDQKVKVGDLGISIKLNADAHPDKKLYVLKGYTRGFEYPGFIESFKNKTKLSKNQLFEGDRHSTIKTFEFLINKTRAL